MIRNLALTLVLALAAGPAMALSCMRPDAVRMFEYARDSKDIFYVIKGRITPVDAYDVPTSKNGSDTATDTPVLISGTGLGPGGFSVPVEIGATVRLTCLSVWCAGPPADEELLMIVKKAGDDLTLEIGPCGGTAIPWNSASEERLLQCHVSDNCVPGDF
ncbi:MAG: hypothetical protein HKN27_11135 [Silicimonas sp.]|nr:hypothetical protein [Silicimonas sp.]